MADSCWNKFVYSAKNVILFDLTTGQSSTPNIYIYIHFCHSFSLQFIAKLIMKHAHFGLVLK